MKEKKKSFRLFSMYDADGIERYLQEEASKGWMLEKVTELFWVFKKQEPKKVVFSVVYLDKASEFDAEPSEEQQIFQDFCEHTGWKFVAGLAQMQIYCNAGTDPVPIETDDEIQLDRMYKSMKRSFFPTWLIMLVVGIEYLMICGCCIFINPLENLANPFILTSALIAFVIFGIAVTQLIGKRVWYKSRLRKFSKGEKITKKRGALRMEIVEAVCLLVLAFTMVLSLGGKSAWPNAIGLVAGILVATGSVMWFIMELKKLRFSVGKNKAVTLFLVVVLSLMLAFVFNMSLERFLAGKKKTEGKIALSLEDLGKDPGNDSVCRVNVNEESILLGYYKAEQKVPMGEFMWPELQYTVVTVKCPLLYGLAEKSLLKRFANRYAEPVEPDTDWKRAFLIDPKPWGAKRAYQLEVMGELQLCYLLCYENRIVKLEMDSRDFCYDFTDAQKQAVNEKLGGK